MSPTPRPAVVGTACHIGHTDVYILHTLDNSPLSSKHVRPLVMFLLQNMWLIPLVNIATKRDLSSARPVKQLDTEAAFALRHASHTQQVFRSECGRIDSKSLPASDQTQISHARYEQPAFHPKI